MCTATICVGIVSLHPKLVIENPLSPYNNYHFIATQSDLQTAILQSKEVETARQLAELRKERDALRTEVEQLKSGKMNERHFSAAFQKEFEKRREFQAKYHQVLDQCSVSGFSNMYGADVVPVHAMITICEMMNIPFTLLYERGSHSTQNIDLLSSFDYFHNILQHLCTSVHEEVQGHMLVHTLSFYVFTGTQGFVKLTIMSKE